MSTNTSSEVTLAQTEPPKVAEQEPQLVALTTPAEKPEIEVDLKEIDYPEAPDDAAYESLEDFDRALEHFGEEEVDDFITAADVERVSVEEAKWIQKAIKRPGGLHRALGVPEGETIPLSRIRAAAKKKGRLGRMARLALTLGKMKRRKEAAKGEVKQEIADVKSAVANANVVDLTEEAKTSLLDGIKAALTEFKSTFMPMKEETAPLEPPKVEPVVAPPVEVEQPPVEALVVEQPAESATIKEEPKVEEKLSEKIKVKTMPEEKVEEAGKGLVEVELPDDNTPVFDLAKPEDKKKLYGVIAEGIRAGIKTRDQNYVQKLRVIKGKVREANEYSLANAGSAIPEIWAQDVLQTTEQFAVMSKLCVQHDELRGKPGDTLHLPTVAGLTFGVGSEAAEALGQAPTTSSVKVTLAERIAEVKYDKSLVEDCVPDLIREINKQFAIAYEYDFDDKALGWMETPIAAIKGTLTETGVLQGTVIAKILGSFRSATHEPKFLIIHPVQEAALMQDSQFVNAATYGNRSVIQSGRVWDYLGIQIVVTPQVVSTGGTYRAFLISDRALHVVNKRNLEIETYYHPPTRTQYLVATGRYGGTVALPNEVWELKTVNG